MRVYVLPLVAIYRCMIPSVCPVLTLWLYSATSIIPGDTSGQLSTLLAVVTVAIWTR